MPLGFEADGAWGPSAVWAFEEVVAVYAEIRDPAQLSGHLAVNFGAHWRKAIGAALAGSRRDSNCVLTPHLTQKRN